MNLRDLRLRLRALVAPRQVERDLDDELAFHVERQTKKYVEAGIDAVEARRRTLAHFGSVPLAADECRDARGTGFIDDLVRDVIYACRGFRRAPLSALAIVLTIAVGLGLVACVFTLYDASFLGNAIARPDELFVVRRPPTPGARVWIPFTRPQYESLRRDTRVFSDVLAATDTTLDARIDGRAGTCRLVTGNYFQVLGVRPTLGRALTPDDDRGAGGAVVVLSDRGWHRLFAGDPTVVGRTSLVNDARYAVVGVMPADFREFDVVDCWAPLSLLDTFNPATAGGQKAPIDPRIFYRLEVIGRLAPGLSREAATAALTAWVAANPDITPPSWNPDARKSISLLSIADASRVMTAISGLLLFVPLFFAFGLVLVIGCANVANLLLARGVARQREIGIRLSLGASRRRVIRQLLTECLLLAFAAAVGGFIVSRLILAGAVQILATTLPPDLTDRFALAVPAADWRVVVFMLSGAIVSTVLFGLGPALRATRSDLTRTARGDTTTDLRPARARNALIVVQVTASALLLITSIVFLRSALAAEAADPGVRTSDTLMASIADESRRVDVVRAASTDPVVAGLAASWPDALHAMAPLGITLSAPAEGRPASMRAVGAARRADSRAVEPVAFKFVSPEYFALLDIDVLQGRTFTPQEHTLDARVAVVSESTARRLWPKGDALGQVVHLERHISGIGPDAHPNSVNGDFSIVGVVRDVGASFAPIVTMQHGIDLFEMPGPAVYVPVGLDTAGTWLTLRVRGDPDQAREHLTRALTSIDPTMGHIETTKAVARTKAYVLWIAFWTTVLLGALALGLAASGLVGVLSYVVAQRTREIGVRKALGATTADVVRLVLTQSARPVVMGLVIGGGLAIVLARLLMATPLAAISAPMGAVPLRLDDIVRVLDPVAYVASLLCIIAACLPAAFVPALRAARVDPLQSLREE
jgi:predicted permease